MPLAAARRVGRAGAAHDIPGRARRSGVDSGNRWRLRRSPRRPVDLVAKERRALRGNQGAQAARPRYRGARAHLGSFRGLTCNAVATEVTRDVVHGDRILPAGASRRGLSAVPRSRAHGAGGRPLRLELGRFSSSGAVSRSWKPTANRRCGSGHATGRTSSPSRSFPCGRQPRPRRPSSRSCEWV